MKIDGDLVGFRDDVIVGDDDAGGVDDEAGAERVDAARRPVRRRGSPPWPRRFLKNSSKNSSNGEPGGSCGRAPGHRDRRAEPRTRLRGGDVDHRVDHLLGDVGDVLRSARAAASEAPAAQARRRPARSKPGGGCVQAMAVSRRAMAVNSPGGVLARHCIQRRCTDAERSERGNGHAWQASRSTAEPADCGRKSGSRHAAISREPARSAAMPITGAKRSRPRASARVRRLQHMRHGALRHGRERPRTGTPRSRTPGRTRRESPTSPSTVTPRHRSAAATSWRRARPAVPALPTLSRDLPDGSTK